MLGDIAFWIIVVGAGVFAIGALLLWFLSSIDFSH